MMIKKRVFLTDGFLGRLISRFRPGGELVHCEENRGQEKPDGSSITDYAQETPPPTAGSSTIDEATAFEETDSEFEPNLCQQAGSTANLQFPGDEFYDERGLDCAGYSRAFYRTTLEHLLERVCRAGRQMRDGNYEYALYDVRFVESVALKLLLRHHGLTPSKLEADILLALKNQLISDYMAERLHGVRAIGNFNEHCEFAPKNLSYRQVYFCIMQTLDLLTVVEKHLLWPEPLLQLSKEWENNPLSVDVINEKAS